MASSPLYDAAAGDTPAPKDALGRRRRVAPPNPSSGRLVLTEADYLIFDAIDRHGPLPSHYLYEFTKHLRRDRSHLQNRLTEFYNGDAGGSYLVRPPQQFASYHARYQHLVYDLAPRASAILAERSPSLAPRRADPFVHRLMGACVGASFELTAPALGLRYISQREILAHPKAAAARASANPLAIQTPAGTLIPDGLFGLEYPGKGFRFFAVEIDRNTESIERRNLAQSSFARKIAGYLAILRTQAYRERWGVPNLHVLTATTSAAHARALLAHIGRHAGDAEAARFGVAVVSGFGAHWRAPSKVLSGVLTGAWCTPLTDKLLSTG
ncbi:replication-relaxation family protein [Sphingomonas sp.]|uniref:replication-relaxation family protein n=1 Tax=Sphingomonas sp. TaxID=28214 RepID=UPI001B2C6548|nr:replication-relaxation family protein [Sphingomonas sp.]MBO9714247.1 hypothetical protein [Sphingomonas sp.]